MLTLVKGLDAEHLDATVVPVLRLSDAAKTVPVRVYLDAARAVPVRVYPDAAKTVPVRPSGRGGRRYRCGYIRGEAGTGAPGTSATRRRRYRFGHYPDAAKTAPKTTPEAVALKQATPWVLISHSSLESSGSSRSKSHISLCVGRKVGGAV